MFFYGPFKCVYISCFQDSYRLYIDMQKVCKYEPVVNINVSVYKHFIPGAHFVGVGTEF